MNTAAIQSAIEFLHSSHTNELFELKKHRGSHYANIWSPGYENNEVDLYVHSLFIEKANDYAKRHGGRLFADHIEELLGQIDADIDAMHVTSVLDLGCAVGNSTASLEQAFPNAAIVASDLSPEMLRVTRERVQSDRVALLQMNAEQMGLADDTFSFIFGRGILHHLIDPKKTLAESRRVLRPGGVAIFQEPCKPGHRVIQELFALFLAHEKASDLPPAFRKMMHRTIYQFFLRISLDKSLPEVQALEDKWIFSRAYLESASKEVGFEHFQFIPQKQVPDQMRMHIHYQLELLKERARMPEWAWEIIDRIDEKYQGSPYLFGTLVLQKL